MPQRYVHDRDDQSRLFCGEESPVDEAVRDNEPEGLLDRGPTAPSKFFGILDVDPVIRCRYIIGS